MKEDLKLRLRRFGRMRGRVDEVELNAMMGGMGLGKRRGVGEQE